MNRRLRPLAAALAIVIGSMTVGTAPADAGPDNDCRRQFPAYDRPAQWPKTVVLRDLPITMSDGVVLRADVHLPVDSAGNRAPGELPTLLTVTGYDKRIGANQPKPFLVARGYAQVVLDDRGTGASGGEWDMWGERTQADYGEVLDWISDQSWSGPIGTIGESYMAETQFFVAKHRHPDHKAMFVVSALADAYRDAGFSGGVANTSFVPAWMVLIPGAGFLPPNHALDDPLAAIRGKLEHLRGLTSLHVPVLSDALIGRGTAYDGPHWRVRSPIEAADQVRTPTFLVGGNDDIFQRGVPMLYEALADRVETKLLMGPWTHLTATAGPHGLPRDGVPGLDHLQLQWFDRWLLKRDTGAECMPDVTQWMRGAEKYEHQTSWPPPQARARQWFLHSNGNLDRGRPRRAEAPRTMPPLPPTSICSGSTHQFLLGALAGTPCAEDERVADIGALTYTTPPLANPLVINGPIQADMWISSTAPDAVVSVTVSDVAPNGSVTRLTGGMLLASQRAVDPAKSRYRNGLSLQPWHPFTRAAERPLEVGTPVKLPIEVWPTSAVLDQGHRLRITLKPGEVPRAMPVGNSADSLGAVTSILHGPDYPSSITLPVLPD